MQAFEEEILGMDMNVQEVWPQTQTEPVIVWDIVDIKHICLSSIGCRFGRKGQCVYCNYGSTDEHSDEVKLEFLKKILQSNRSKGVVVGSFGSYFDSEEVSWDLFTSINELLAETDIQSIIFETHCSTVNKKYLDAIKQKFSKTKKSIAIEMGLESSNPRVLKDCINKTLDIEEFSKTITLIKEYGFSVITNVILGAPYLSPQEQLRDTYNSTKWALANGTDIVVIFPVNIKENTPLYKLYKEKKYELVSHWLLIRLLDILNEDLLSSVALSWVGLRQAAGRNMEVVPPKSCSKCQEKLLNFYREFNGKFDGLYRRKILVELKNNVKFCECPEKLEFEKIP